MVYFADKVAAGVQFLDDNAPMGWRSLITRDPDLLEMTSPHGCVLGIVFGEFWTACRRFSGADTDSETYFSDMHEWAAAHGFVVHDDDNTAVDPDDPEDDTDGSYVWDELDAEWRAALDIAS